MRSTRPTAGDIEIVRDFYDAHLLRIGDRAEPIPNAAMYAAFLGWRDCPGGWSHRRLTRALVAAGFEQEARRDRGRRWKELKLVNVRAA